MRVFAIHDAAGAISQVITCPDDGPRPFLQTPPGLSMTEIELPTGEKQAKLDPENPEGIIRLLEGYRVQVASGKSTLMR